jgi:DNA-binding transcriptional regulator YhcF (GntR family)
MKGKKESVVTAEQETRRILNEMMEKDVAALKEDIAQMQALEMSNERLLELVRELQALVKFW